MAKVRSLLKNLIQLCVQGGDASSRWLWSGFSMKARKRRELEQAKDAEGFRKKPRRLDQKVRGQE